MTTLQTKQYSHIKEECVHRRGESWSTRAKESLKGKTVDAPCWGESEARSQHYTAKVLKCDWIESSWLPHFLALEPWAISYLTALTPTFLITRPSEECHELIMPFLTIIIQLLTTPSRSGHSFESISPLWPPLPGQAIKLFFSTLPKTLSRKFNLMSVLQRPYLASIRLSALLLLRHPEEDL